MEERSFKELNIIFEDGDRSKNYPTTDELSSSGHCLFLNTRNILDNKFCKADVYYISKEKHELLGSGSVFYDDIIITTRGTLGNILFVDNKIKLPCRINSSMVIMHPNNQFIPRFIYFYLISNKFKNYIKELQSGAAQPQLPIKDLEKIQLPIYSRIEQQHIVNTISSLLLKFL